MRRSWSRIGTLGLAFAALAVLIGASLAAAGEKPVKWSEESGLSEPKAVEKTPPAYPEEAKKERVQGAVVLEATIGEDGAVSDLVAIEAPAPAAEPEAAPVALTFWQKLLKLFGLYKG